MAEIKKIKPRLVLPKKAPLRVMCAACADFTTEPNCYEGDDIDYCSNCFFTPEQWAALNAKIAAEIAAEKAEALAKERELAAEKAAAQAAKLAEINAKIAAKKTAAALAKTTELAAAKKKKAAEAPAPVAVAEPAAVSEKPIKKIKPRLQGVATSRAVQSSSENSS